MKRLSILMMSLMVGLTWYPAQFAQAAPVKHDHEHKMDHHHKHHHKLLEREQVKELEDKGYTKADIFRAAMLSKKSDKKIDEVLDIHKETKSWEKTAEKLGVDKEELKRIESMIEWKEFVTKNEPAVKEYLASYSNKTIEEIDAYIEDGLHLRFLIGAAALAKVSGKSLDEIVALKKDGKSFHDVLDTLKVDMEDLHKELDKFKAGAQQSVNENSSS
ncbi:hypothetical protein EKG37_10870 [Robertmurraya yapensis]|uniref:Uncharacterized protein n=2 Tax=Bacillaceae TaxID=186817 RepID=A0A431W7G2_9BACI|nr:hypothetical protein [Bacillus yapensis]RTR31376.1 hypothetical protein EKG37_10870 [Bacillus yapensis]TKS95600.1 hypothetical protein FAR12_10870 [Bacillus yapensis]